MKFTKNNIALVVGGFLALVHAIWALVIALSPEMMQSFVDWVLNIHFIGISVVILPFMFWDAIQLVILTFVAGYIFGWLFVWVADILKDKN